MRAWLWLALAAACSTSACGDDGGYTAICLGCSLDSGTDGRLHDFCDPLTQTGCYADEKCTWIVDATLPQYVGHIGCVPDGAAHLGAGCMYGAAGATGYDDCARGAVCSGYAQPGLAGVCKQICDIQGGNPVCDATHSCVQERFLFSSGSTSPAAAGLCEQTCDPLADNDFDGSGSALARTGSACGSADIGCYGLPSGGTAPRTAFTCMPERNYTASLRHRAECTTATGCADENGEIYVNSCNQGYLPLFRESTAVSTAVCIAMCAPLDCYAGHCGSGDVNRIGAAPHRCTTPDALGTFGSDESCEYLWREEVDGQDTWLPSANSNAVGFCFDHSQYLYDPSGGNNPTIPYPSCEQLQLHASGSDRTMPLTYFGAVDFGCVSTTTGGVMFSGKVARPTIDLPRAPYHRATLGNTAGLP